MITTFQELSAQLNLSSEYIENGQIEESLENWCKTHISSDLDFEGNAEDTYYFYHTVAKDYFDIFITHLPPSPTTVSTKFNSMNAIQYAALQGYNFL